MGIRDFIRSDRIYHEIDARGNLSSQLTKLIDAIKGGGNNGPVLTAINELNGKVDTMSSNIDRIEKEAADAAENVGLVRTAIEDLKAASDAMKAEIASLKEQVAQGQVDQARLDAAAAVFEKADDEIDAIVLPAPAPGGESGGDTGTGDTGTGGTA